MICFDDLLPGDSVELAPCGFQGASYHSTCLCKLEETQISELFCLGDDLDLSVLNTSVSTSTASPNRPICLVDHAHRRFKTIYRCPHCNKCVNHLSRSGFVCGNHLNHPMKSRSVSKLISRIKKSTTSNHWCCLLPLYVCNWLTQILYNFSISKNAMYGIFHSPFFCTQGGNLLRSKQKERFVIRHIVSCIVGLLHSSIKSDLGVRVLNNFCGDAFRKLIVCRSSMSCNNNQQQYEIGVELKRVSFFGLNNLHIDHDGYELSVMKRRFCRKSLASSTTTLFCI